MKKSPPRPLEDLLAVVGAIEEVSPTTVQPMPIKPHIVKPAGPTSMQPTALVFLEDAIARRLAVAWTACGGNDKEWLETAGFAYHHADAMRQAKALRANGVCRDGGVTDPLALQYIHAMIARQLPTKTKDKK